MVIADPSSLPARHPHLSLLSFIAGQRVMLRNFQDSKHLFNPSTSTSHMPKLQGPSSVHLSQPKPSVNILGSTQLFMVVLLESTSSGKLFIF